MEEFVIPSELIYKIDSSLRRNFYTSKDLVFKISIQGSESELMNEISRRSRYTGVTPEELASLNKEKFYKMKPVYDYLKEIGYVEGKDFFYCELVGDIVANLTRERIVEIARLESVARMNISSKRFPND